MAKKRVYELAKELGMQNKELVDWLQARGYDEVKSHSSSLDDDVAQSVLDKVLAARNPAPAAPAAQGFVVRRRRAEPSAPAAEAAHGEAPAAHAAEEAEAEAPAEEFEAAPAAEEEMAPETAEEPVVAEEPEIVAKAEVEAEEAAPAPVPEAPPVPVAPPAPVAPAAPAARDTRPAQEPRALSPSQMAAAHAVPTPNMPGIRGPNVPAQAGVDHRTLRPTATQAVVISRPLIPVRRVTPPSSTFKPAPAAPGKRAIGEVREFRVVPDSQGRGRDFIDVTRTGAGGPARGRRGAGRAAPAAAPGGIPSKQDLIDLAKGRGGALPVRARKRKPTKKGAKTLITTPKGSKRVIRVEEAISLTDLSQRLGVKANDLIRKLMRMGVPAQINQMLDVDTAQLLAADYDYTVEKAGYIEEEFISAVEDRPEDLVSRPPVVTIMGHVDHGKTSLLDALRHANVAKGEAGGITQHIGAYSVQTAKGPVTFLDTPGHEAFTAMRARGVQATDVAVLVVAADDGVMPQTVESINHAKAAEVPIIVAINKVDKPEGNPDRVKQMLAEHGLVPEEWGGETIMIPVSAKAKLNLDQLLEYIALQSEVLELGANPTKPASGVVIEAKLEKGRGPVATVLVQEGTLKVGEAVVTGTHFGKLRAMTDDKGRPVKEVKPGYPVEIVGLSGVPSAGDEFHVVKDVRAAEEVAKNRELQERKKELTKTSKLTLEEIFAKAGKADQKELKIVLKADVQGSTEAVAQALDKLSTAKVRVHIIHKGVGAVTESDINLAKASGAVVLGFNTKAESKVAEVANRFGIDVRHYTVIYEAVDDVRLAMEGLLDILTRERTIGKAEVRTLFSVPKFGVIAGSAVLDGKILRSAYARVLRGGKKVFQGKISSLRRFKDDVKEVVQGFECGIALEGYTELAAGDIIEAFDIEQIRQKL
ncbi:translation initiation factor IF-2 [Vulgatibacter incomptus]|uniref:Translation initiation factor IF-2 n=1 Tax=Vulgatibacter incomptus TaxID=1391653 RepID=A0A0K1PA74_9BACT|nr:translation initiation factor IF-2 [Vulgatibacter incomptus]AKU90019.1 Translation initiation factor 2 [Vulgatibacter incomptus]